MPSSYMYYKNPRSSNKIMWLVLIVLFATTLISFLYLSFFRDGDGFYEKDFYEKVSGIAIPSSSEVSESYDNGEYWTATSFKIIKDSIKQFIGDFDFQTCDSGVFSPTMFSQTWFREKPDFRSRIYLCNSGSRGKNNWIYVLDTTKNILWAEVHYPDWGGD